MRVSINEIAFLTVYVAMVKVVQIFLHLRWLGLQL